MSRPTYSKIQTFKDAEEYLGDKTVRPSDVHKTNTVIERLDNDTIVVRYYGTVIVNFYRNKEKDCNYKGAFNGTKSTQIRCKAFSL